MLSNDEKIAILDRERERLKTEGFCSCREGYPRLDAPDAIGRVLCSMCQKPATLMGYPIYVTEVTTDAEQIQE